MDPTMITKLVAAGAMGVSIYCVIKVLDLIKEEQKNPSPRPAFLRTIYVTMGFAILMTVLSLGIEVVRHNMDQEAGKVEESLNQFQSRLQHLDTMRYYSINSQGQPQTIKVEVAGEEYNISEPYTADISRDLLKLDHFDGQFLAKRRVNSIDYPVGYFNREELESSAKELFSDLLGGSLTPEELLNLATFYVSDTLVISADQKDIDKANKYLIDLLTLPDFNERKKRRQAVKLLVQPQALKRLDNDQHDILISELRDKSKKTSLEPYLYWELAQVYLSKFKRFKDESDRESHYDYLERYVEDCDLNEGYTTSKDYSIINTWYIKAAEELKNRLVR